MKTTHKLLVTYSLIVSDLRENVAIKITDTPDGDLNTNARSTLV
jgi:hypothetical protein